MVSRVGFFEFDGGFVGEGVEDGSMRSVVMGFGNQKLENGNWGFAVEPSYGIDAAYTG
jgi:hypothetical protein